jgi:hypothetical protein
MAVTDDEVAVLRAGLSGNEALQRELQARLVSPAARSRYATFVTAAFFEAADRRFADGGTAADVIAFVADVRSRSDRLAESIDPRAAERLIRSVALTEEDISDLDTETKGRLFIVLLGGLVSDEHYNEDELDEFLAEARKTADGWLAR